MGKKCTGWFDRYYNFREEVLHNVSQTLKGKNVDLSEENFRALITERHCGESFTGTVETVSEYGFVSDGEEFSWSEMSLGDICCVLDYLNKGEW